MVFFCFCLFLIFCHFFIIFSLVSCHYGNGRCVLDIFGGYNCKCLSGYIGKYCDLDITVGPTFFEPEDDYRVGPTFFEPEDEYEVGPTFFEPKEDYEGHFNI